MLLLTSSKTWYLNILHFVYIKWIYIKWLLQLFIPIDCLILCIDIGVTSPKSWRTNIFYIPRTPSELCVNINSETNGKSFWFLYIVKRTGAISILLTEILQQSWRKVNVRKYYVRNYYNITYITSDAGIRHDLHVNYENYFWCKMCI